MHCVRACSPTYLLSNLPIARMWSAKTNDELVAEIQRLRTERDDAATTDPQPAFDVRQTVDQLNLVGVTIERDGTLSYVNPYTCRVTAWQPGDVVGKNFFDIFIPATDRARLELEFEDALIKGGFPEQKEISVLARSGAVRTVQLNSFIVNRSGRDVSSFTIIGEDITNKRRVASALSSTNAQLQDLVDNTSDLIQLLTLDGKFMFVNRAWREVLGYGSDEIAALNLRNGVSLHFARHDGESTGRKIAETLLQHRQLDHQRPQLRRPLPQDSR